MSDPFDYDAVVKDVFERDGPTMLDDLANGVPVQEFLNVELPTVQKRVADLVVLLQNRTILHLDFQSANDPRMVYREGFYGISIANKFHGRGIRRIDQVVIYCGSRPMRMKSAIDLGGIQISYRLIDIREFDADKLIASDRPGDYTLAMLAGGGVEKLREIVKRVMQLPPPQRQRVLTQMAILSGLRAASGRLKMEVNSMAHGLTIDENVFLRDIRDAALARGREEGKLEGKLEGRAEGMMQVLRGQMRSKFGSLPRWADARLKSATAAQAETWAQKLLTADTLEGVLGKR